MPPLAIDRGADRELWIDRGVQISWKKTVGRDADRYNDEHPGRRDAGDDTGVPLLLSSVFGRAAWASNLARVDVDGAAHGQEYLPMSPSGDCT